MPAVDTIENEQIPCLLNSRIDNGRFLLRKRLGAGGYSVVYLATDLFSPRHDSVAVKCLLHDTNHRRLKTSREVALHDRASALHGVVKFFRAVEENGLLFIVLEYCPDGDLFSAITETRLFLGRDNLIKSGFLQLLDTIQALHGMGIYHRDLKPENVICTENGTRLLLTDFGLATESEYSDKFGCGSYFYMTPECLVGAYSTVIKAYSSRAADIWALGIILVNLICSRSPWKTAMPSDPSFFRYMKNRRWIQQMLPLSTPAFLFVDRIFSNHGNNISLTDLRAQFLKIDTFYMTASELARADKTARLVAREWIPDIPVDDIKTDDLLHMIHVDDVDEAHLFEDKVIAVSTVTVDAGSADSLTPFSSVETDAESRFSDLLVKEQFSSGSPALTHSTSSGSTSDFPITPETKPVRPAEAVPDLPANQDLGEKWSLTKGQVHSFRKTLVPIKEGVVLDHFVL